MCQGRIAHFTRDGRSFHAGEDRQASELVGSRSGVQLAGRHLAEVLHQALACSTDLPFTLAVIIEAEALQIAQLSPSNATSAMLLAVQFN